MTDEGKLRAELDRANRAKRIVEDDLFTEAVESIRNALYRSFAESKLDDDDTRRCARIGVGLLDRLVGDIRYHIETGKLAGKTLDQLEKVNGRQSGDGI